MSEDFRGFDTDTRTTNGRPDGPLDRSAQAGRPEGDGGSSPFGGFDDDAAVSDADKTGELEPVGPAGTGAGSEETTAFEPVGAGPQDALPGEGAPPPREFPPSVPADPDVLVFRPRRAARDEGEDDLPPLIPGEIPGLGGASAHARAAGPSALVGAPAGVGPSTGPAGASEGGRRRTAAANPEATETFLAVGPEGTDADAEWAPGRGRGHAGHRGGSDDDHPGLRMALRVAGLVLGAVVLVGGGFALGTRFGDELVDAVFPSVAANRPQVETQTVELADAYDGALTRRVAAAAADVAANALSTPTLDEATAGAIGGLLTSGGDVDAAYLTQEEYERAQRLAAGVHVGIGASFVDAPEGVVVALVADDSPAQQAGLAVGDVVTALDGEPFAGDAAELTDALAQRAPGSEIELSWTGAHAATMAGATGEGTRVQGAAGADEAEAAPAEATGEGERADGTSDVHETTATMAIAEVDAPLVAGRLEGTTGVLTLLRCAPGVADELAGAIAELLDAGATSLVLDVRVCTGGEVAEAVRVASLFMESGTVAVSTTRDGSERLEVVGGLYATDAPLVLLVSHDTAGAAEVLAGALQDHQRALVVGELTHGTGTSQTVRTLSSGGALSYTTARYQTPDGYDIQGQGIAPDVLVASPLSTSERLAAAAAADGDAPASGEDAFAAGAGSAGAADADAQLAAAIEAARSWQEGGSIAIEGLSNAPGPQQEAFGQAAEALERAQAAALIRAAGGVPASEAGGAGAADGAAADGAGDASAQADAGADATAPQAQVAGTDAAGTDATAGGTAGEGAALDEAPEAQPAAADADAEDAPEAPAAADGASQ